MENYLDQISASVAIIVFISYVAFKYSKGRKILLADIVLAVLAGGMLPLAVAFAVFAFYPQYIGDIESMSLQITITGLVLVFVYVKTIVERINSS